MNYIRRDVEGKILAVSMIPGFLLYLAAVTLLGVVSDREAEQMPGGWERPPCCGSWRRKIVST